MILDFDYNTLETPWWPFFFILLAGWLPTDIWRWLGVLSSGRISETSPLIVGARAIATGLVAAVIARLVLFPGGSLAAIPDWVRIAALVCGFFAYLWLGRQTLIAIVVAEIVLLGIPWMMGII